MLNLSLNELKLVARSRCIKCYKSMSKERLLSALSESESVESKNSFHDKRLKKIRKDFNELREIFKASNKRNWRKSFWIRKESFNIKETLNTKI